MELTGGIEVRITGGTPLEVLARITAWGLRCNSEPRVHALATQIMQLEEKLSAHPPEGAAPAADPSGPAAGENGQSVARSEETTDADPAPATSPDPVPTQEEVTAKGREAAKKYGSAAIKPILKEFGVERMSELAEKDRAPFLKRLEELGGKNA